MYARSVALCFWTLCTTGIGSSVIGKAGYSASRSKGMRDGRRTDWKRRKEGSLVHHAYDRI
jgi:hypothetical protein